VLVADKHVLAELSQPLLKPGFRGRYLARQDRADSFVKGPKLGRRHRFEIMRLHFTNSYNICTDALLAVVLEIVLADTKFPPVAHIKYRRAGTCIVTSVTKVIITFGSPDLAKNFCVRADPTRSHLIGRQPSRMPCTMFDHRDSEVARHGGIMADWSRRSRTR
jgi:hypothetical protein